MRRTKMSAVCAVTLLLLICPALTSTDAEQCDHHIMVGGRVVLQSFSWDSSLRLRWMHESKLIYDSNRKDNEYGIDGKGSLILSDVTKSHEGQYGSEVVNKNTGASMGKKTTRVCVVDRIQKPTLKASCPSASSVVFTCSTDQQVDGVTYQWSEGGKPVENQSNSTLVRRSNQLGGNSFRCKVSASKLSETSDVVKQTCLKPDKTKLFGLDFWLMVGILAGGGGLVLVLIVATIVCCTKTRRKKRMQGEEEQELRLEWSNTQQQQQQQQHPHPHPHPHHHHPHSQHPHPPHHHPHHQQHHQQQPAGHTGPRQPRPKQPRPRAPEHGNGHPQPSPRRPAQTSRPTIGADDEKPPPLPQPRKKTPRT